MKTYKDRDKSLLKSIPSPKEPYEHFIETLEFTFLGAGGQPDFGHIKIWFYAKEMTIELKSLKEYFYSWRNIHVSYERVINCIFDDLVEVFRPDRLRIQIDFKPRGGLSSSVCIDSDWGVRGGTDEAWKYHS